MVVGHFEKNETILACIYSFHMPAFLVVSGFLFSPHSWKKTIIAFTVPVVLFSLINLVVNLLLCRMTIDSLTVQYVLIHTFDWRHGLGEGLFKGVWFIWALVGLRLLFGDIPWLQSIRKYYIYIAVCMIAFMTFVHIFVSIDTLFYGYYLGTIVPSLPFFCFGLLLKELQWNPPKTNSYKAIILFALLILLVPVINNDCDIYNSNYGYSYLIAAPVAILFTLLLFWAVSRLPNSKFIKTISKGTLLVLGTHMSILHILEKLLPNQLSLVFPIITIIICYFLILLCERFCPIMLGKYK